MVRTFTKRYFLPLVPAFVLVGVAGMAGAATIGQPMPKATTETSANDQSSNSASQPVVTVNGKRVSVPDNGTSTLNQGGTKTTVTHHQSDQDVDASDADSAPDNSSDDAVSISVTSNTSGNNTGHSHYSSHSSSTTGSTVHSSITVQTNGPGKVSVTK